MVACIASFVGTSFVAAEPSDEGSLLISTSSGFVKLDALEAEQYIQAEQYLRARLGEVAAVRPGVTFAQIKHFFKNDGGISAPPPHRFVNIRCPYIKLEVSFEGESKGRDLFPIPDEAIVKTVSRPYLEPPLYD